MGAHRYLRGGALHVSAQAAIPPPPLTPCKHHHLYLQLASPCSTWQHRYNRLAARLLLGSNNSFVSLDPIFTPQLRHFSCPPPASSRRLSALLLELSRIRLSAAARRQSLLNSALVLVLLRLQAAQKPFVHCITSFTSSLRHRPRRSPLVLPILDSQLHLRCFNRLDSTRSTRLFYSFHRLSPALPPPS